jgi:hypothetical protein
MAQTNFTPISLYYSTTAAAVPTAGNLVAGELAINTQDGKLFYKDAAGVVQTIASKDVNSGTFTNISVSGVASFADGTVSLPSITNIGDTNTGIFFPAADTIAFTEGGVESMRIDSSGNVGIGTSSPAATLDVTHSNGGRVRIRGVSADGARLELFNNAATTNGFLIGQGFGSGSDNIAYISNQATASLIFRTSASERVRIDEFGNVGIGTSSPNTKLHIFGASLSDLRIASNNVSYINYVDASFSVQGTTTNHPMVFNTNNTERMRITNGGNVLLGTSSGDGGKLDIFGAEGFAGCGVSIYETSSGNNKRLRLSQQASGVVYNATATSGNNAHIWQVTNTEAMRIDAGGQVYMGTNTSSFGTLNVQRFSSAPYASLTIQDNATPANAVGLYLRSNSTTPSGISTAGSPMAFYVGGAGAGEAMRIDSSGQVGIGISSPANLFDVLSTVSYTGNIGKFRAQNSTTYGGSVLVVTGDRTTTNSSYNLINCFNGSGTGVLLVRDSGNCLNTNNSYGGTSDVKLKENIVDATPKLNDLMQVKVRHYNFKNKPNEKQIGVVAQELETVFPSMVEESPDSDLDGNLLETTTKSVKYSVFVPMLIKAIQEQQTLIENLTTRLNALEGK